MMEDEEILRTFTIQCPIAIKETMSYNKQASLARDSTGILTLGLCVWTLRSVSKRLLQYFQILPDSEMSVNEFPFIGCKSISFPFEAAWKQTLKIHCVTPAHCNANSMTHLKPLAHLNALT